MIVTLSLVIVGLLVTLLISYQLERAPEGFEDERGFHFLSPGADRSATKAPPLANAGKVLG